MNKRTGIVAAVTVIAITAVLVSVMVLSSLTASTNKDTHYDSSVPASQRIGSVTVSGYLSVHTSVGWLSQPADPETTVSVSSFGATFTPAAGVAPSEPAPPIDTSYVPDGMVLLRLNISLERPGMAALYDVQHLILSKDTFMTEFETTAPFLITKTGAYTVKIIAEMDGKVVGSHTFNKVVQ